MGKIRVQDLSKMLGIPDQDLIFKLRSIGVRVEGKDAVVNTDVLKAVLEGRQLATPREVIVRDEESKATAPKRRPGLRRPPGPPPRRPRSVIQRVEPRIRTIPVRETPVKSADPVQQEPAADEAAIAAATTAEVTTEAPTSVEAPPPQGTTTAATSPTAAAEMAPEVVVEEPRKSRRDRRREASQTGEEDAAAAVDRGTITVVEGMTVREFADKLELKSKDLIKRLV